MQVHDSCGHICQSAGRHVGAESDTWCEPRAINCDRNLTELGNICIRKWLQLCVRRSQTRMKNSYRFKCVRSKDLNISTLVKLRFAFLVSLHHVLGITMVSGNDVDPTNLLDCIKNHVGIRLGTDSLITKTSLFFIKGSQSNSNHATDMSQRLQTDPSQQLQLQ